MPKLEVGSMDDIKTGFEPIPEAKKVRVKVVPPAEGQSEVYSDPDGNFAIAKFNLQIQEGQYANRRIQFSAFCAVKEDTYVSWKLKTEGRDMTTEEKHAAYARRDYLKDLKRFSDAIGVNFESDSTEDCYGKELLVDIKIKEDKEGNLQNEAKNPRKAA